jgi:hypothetical protein
MTRRNRGQHVHRNPFNKRELQTRFAQLRIINRLPLIRITNDRAGVPSSSKFATYRRPKLAVAFSSVSA